MTEPVILLHGLWLRGATMGVFAQRLRGAGFVPETFDYASVRSDAGEAVARLAERIRALGSPRVHLVGHSMGGLIALATLREHPRLTDGRVVCLGSPLRGSAAARGLRQWPMGAAMLGHSAAILGDGFERWDGPNEVGMIAGRLPIGLGFLFGGFSGPHDGTVSVEETRLPGLTDHITIAAAHTGLAWSAEAAQQTAVFLATGRFQPARPA
jgi:pimeloyl-ACP methyl ester carboxylesterase